MEKKKEYRNLTCDVMIGKNEQLQKISIQIWRSGGKDDNEGTKAEK